MTATDIKNKIENDYKLNLKNWIFEIISNGKRLRFFDKDLPHKDWICTVGLGINDEDIEDIGWRLEFYHPELKITYP